MRAALRGLAIAAQLIAILTLGCSSTVRGGGGAAAGTSSVDGGGAGSSNQTGGTAGTANSGSGASSTTGGASGAGASAGGAGGSAGAPPLKPFDELAGATFASVSADGTTVAGVYGNQAGIWRNGQFTWIDYLTGGRPPSTATGISADGSTVVGWEYTALGSSAFIWDGTTRELPPIFTSATSAGAEAYGISGDSHVVVGMTVDASNTEITVRWTDGVIGQLPNPTSITGRGVPADANSDGSLIVGTFRAQIDQAVRWPANGAVTLGIDRSEVAAVSDDGTYVVGDYYPSSSQARVAFRWSAGYGREDLPVPSSTNLMDCTSAGTNGDGSIVVGTCVEQTTSGQTYHPYVWSQAAGMMPMETLLSRLGVDPSQYTQMKAVGVSKNGNAVIGNGMRGLTEVGWRAIITEVFP